MNFMKIAKNGEKSRFETKLSENASFLPVA